MPYTLRVLTSDVHPLLQHIHSNMPLVGPQCVCYAFVVDVISGSKWHYAPMAQQLAQAGVLTCVIQYSLYPDALAPQMVDELSQALTWTFKNISQQGGNPNQVAAALPALPAMPSGICRTPMW